MNRCSMLLKVPINRVSHVCIVYIYIYIFKVVVTTLVCFKIFFVFWIPFICVQSKTFFACRGIGVNNFLRKKVRHTIILLPYTL